MAVITGENEPTAGACCCDALHLTEREIDVLCVLADGKTSRQAAEVLRLSRRTVDAHVTAMLRKAAVHNRGELLATAVGHGMIDMRVAPPRWTGRSCLPAQRGSSEDEGGTARVAHRAVVLGVGEREDLVDAVPDKQPGHHGGGKRA